MATKTTKKKTAKKKKGPGGRPSKLNKTFLNAADEVLFGGEDNIPAIIFTDEELLDEINERIKSKKDRVGQRTFARWKADILNKDKEELDETAKEFWHLIKKALREQKNYLFDALKGDKQAWQRFAWILERKFDAWNLRKKVNAKMHGDVEITAINSTKHTSSFSMRSPLSSCLVVLLVVRNHG